MGKIVRQGVEYCGSSDSATSIKYDNTKNVKEAIDEIKNTAEIQIGTTKPSSKGLWFNTTNN